MERAGKYLMSMQWTMRGMDATLRGMLTVRSSGAGSDFQCRPEVEAVRSSTWRGWARQLGNPVKRSGAEGVVK